MLIKYKKIVIKSIKLPILENDVIIPIVINIIKNLIYIFKKKFLSSFLSWSKCIFFNISKLATKQMSKKMLKTVRLVKKPVDESL